MATCITWWEAQTSRANCESVWGSEPLNSKSIKFQNPHVKEHLIFLYEMNNNYKNESWNLFFEGQCSFKLVNIYISLQWELNQIVTRKDSKHITSKDNHTSPPNIDAWCKHKQKDEVFHLLFQHLSKCYSFPEGLVYWIRMLVFSLLFLSPDSKAFMHTCENQEPFNVFKHSINFKVKTI